MSSALNYCLGLLLGCTLSLPLAQASSSERIDHFDIHLKVEPSGELLITERIQVTAAGERIRRGIYRDIPTTYSLPAGLLRKTPIELLRVQRDGRSEAYKKERTSWGVRYYLGSPEVLIEPGPHLYELQYRMDAQLYFAADKDQLYWNLTGNQWQLPITQATATIELPAGARIDQLTGYTGYAGSRSGRAYQVLEQSGNSVKLATTQPLAAEEGFTVALDWQAGLVKRPNVLVRAARLALDNLNALAAVLVVLGLFFYYLRWWQKVGRDPAKGVIIPRYEAPAEVSPARAGDVWRKGARRHFSDIEAFTVTITDLARRKVLSIADAPKGKAFILSKGSLDANAQPHEQALFEQMFADDKNEIRVGNKYVKALSGALSAHSEKLGEWADGLFRMNRKHWFLGLLGAVLAFIAIGVLDGLASRYVAGGIALSLLLVCLFFTWLEAPTVQGRGILDELEGYRDYLQLAESDSLARAADAPAMSIALYERHLPFAMALGVEKQWTARLSAAIASGVVQWSEATYQPEWYRSSSHYSSPSAFNSALTAAAATASTPPPSPSSGSSSSSSSSSSGGGSSGGGGGGGGGGGW